MHRNLFREPQLNFIDSCLSLGTGGLAKAELPQLCFLAHKTQLLPVKAEKEWAWVSHGISLLPSVPNNTTPLRAPGDK